MARFLLFAAAAGLALCAGLADQAWWRDHVVIPACYLPPASWALPATRMALACAAAALALLAVRVKRLDPRMLGAVVLAFCAAELIWRAVEKPEGETPHPRLEWLLGAPDPQTGWSFVPRRSLRFAAPGGGKPVDYFIDAHGDRAASVDWQEDPDAPTVLVAGESIAVGHGLAWADGFGAQLGALLHAQVVVVAEGGYGSDQAYLRAREALRRLRHPIALVTTVLPVQLHRNLDDSRPHLVLREGNLVLQPAFSPRIRLRELFVDVLPVMPDWRIEESERLTRAVLHATASLGVRTLFVVPSYGVKRALDQHPEAPLLHAILDGLPAVVVDLDPARIMPWDGHPDAQGARELAQAAAEALR